MGRRPESISKSRSVFEAKVLASSSFSQLNPLLFLEKSQGSCEFRTELDPCFLEETQKSSKKRAKQPCQGTLWEEGPRLFQKVARFSEARCSPTAQEKKETKEKKGKKQTEKELRESNSLADGQFQKVRGETVFEWKEEALRPKR